MHNLNDELDCYQIKNTCVYIKATDIMTSFSLILRDQLSSRLMML
jgi:hypothetical protein